MLSPPRHVLWPKSPPLLLLLALALALALPGLARAQTCNRTLTANVVAFDQVWFWNRLGAVEPQGMMFALERDVIQNGLGAQLRPDKRPRPIVLRMNVGDCLQIHLTNLLQPFRVDDNQSNTRQASIHAVGMQLVTSFLDDGSYVGQNPSSMPSPGDDEFYTLYAAREGEHLLYSAGATNGGEGDGGHVSNGLFGAIIVEPAGSRWYRSQVTRQDLEYATTGTTANGFPIINYEARYPAGHPRAGLPILNMLDGTEIVHTDLTAVIAGSLPSGGGRFPAGTFPQNVYTLPDREQPFREFVTIYHDEIGAVQAFPVFEDNVLQHTLHGGRDAFAINYGTGGIGAEIYANRIRVGPMHDCGECKFEEFFLTSWVVGDPAMIVDVPANAPCMVSTQSPNTVNNQTSGFSSNVSNLRNGTPCSPTTGPKATKAFFPDDPSNVYHSYLNDHTKFRVLHAGPKEHHIHHLHAHQWLFTADSDKSSYLDSQALGPGSSFTAEIAYEGGGNLNKTVGDSIFHCHFYPHFAQGMWSLWRVHDVLEKGTRLNSVGQPIEELGNRALPDGEISQGTPIPAIIPLPGKPMPPLPGANVLISQGQVQVSGTGNPGYPFFIPGIAGRRPPKPPLDTIDDGGLPRHVISQVIGYVEAHDRLDWHKELRVAQAQWLPEAGTAVEQAAMTFHEQRQHGTCRPNGTCDGATPVKFITNGRPRVAGAPYADPCVRANGTAVTAFRRYKGADIEDDVKINKAGWHFPQQRFSALWEDVNAFLGLAGNPKKTPEPLFFRANSDECIEFWLANLVPKEYLLDDFQVRTPTDILGQHIHLVKFDVTSSDGAANGFNYEDGSFSPGEVRERITAIRRFNSCLPSDPRNGTLACPLAETHPFFGVGPDKDGDGQGDWIGAQTTVQRWYADPVRDNAGTDRTLRTVFTHDHFGPSTHQQAGLYAGLVIEPTGSLWYHNETGVQFPSASRTDGGPTTWQAVIDPPSEPSYREFLLEFGDFQLAYEADSAPCRFDENLLAFRCDDPDDAINPPGRREVGIPDLLARPVNCPTKDGSPGPPPPCPEIISAEDPGTMSVNYRQEPIALRVRNPATNSQAAGQAGDLSFAFSSSATITRADPAFNVQPTFYPPLTSDLNGRDPFTPLLRTYENDRVQVRILVGAHEEGHNFSIHGVKWLFEPSEPNSGFRNSQMMGISEHFEFIVPQIVKKPSGDAVDRLWSAGSSTDDYWNGIWGLLRAYTGLRNDLYRLPDNPNGRADVDPSAIGAFDFSCPKNVPFRDFDVSAVAASTALPNGRLTYNSRDDNGFLPLYDPTSIVYVRSGDLDANGKVVPGLSIRMEPLILRARAGECIRLTLRNRLPATPFDLNGYNTLPPIVEGFNANDIKPSVNVGLHPQLLYYDVSRFDGANIGVNPVQTVAPGHFTTYQWYAGDVTINDATGAVTATPIEFGATNLISSDRIEHASKGAIGALIIEPADAAITEHNPLRRSEADITSSTAGNYREYVLVFQNDINMRTEESIGQGCDPGFVPPPGGDWPVENLGCMEDSEDTGQKAINFRTEPLWKRMQHSPGTDFSFTDILNWSGVFSNTKVLGDPVTPVYSVQRTTPVRFRILMPGGHSRNIVFALHGHIWDKEPYVQNSTRLGRNGFSFWEGARMGHGPSNHFDALLRSGAGGAFGITGDYLFRDQTGPGVDNGLWGILRVTN